MISWLRKTKLKKPNIETELEEAKKKITDYDENFSKIHSLTTQLNEVSKSLKKSERLFRSLSELTPSFILVLDSNKSIIYSNQKFDKLVGYTNLDCPLSFNMIIEYLKPDDRNNLINIIDDYLATHSTVPKEFVLELKWNNLIDKSIKLFIQYINFENDLCLLLTGVDITDEITVFNNLKLKNKHFEYLINANPVSIIIADLSELQTSLSQLSEKYNSFNDFKTFLSSSDIEPSEYEFIVNTLLSCIRLDNINKYAISNLCLYDDDIDTPDSILDHYQQFLKLNPSLLLSLMDACFSNNVKTVFQLSLKLLCGEEKLYIIKWYIPPDNGIKGIKNVLLTYIDISSLVI